MHRLAQIVYMETKFDTSDKGGGTTDIIRDGIFHKNSEIQNFDHDRNEEILEYLKVEPAAEKLRIYTSNWLRHVTRMNNNKMRTVMLKYRKNGRRILGRTLKRLLDEVETGLVRPNS
jgi:hypothetical protein